MSDHDYTYVECNACGVESRKEDKSLYGRDYQTAPPGWLHVTNRDKEKLWDICPDCSKEFTKWLLSTAVQKQTPIGVVIKDARQIATHDGGSDD